MITVIPRSTRELAVSFKKMVPGRLYRFTYEAAVGVAPSVVIGMAGRGMDNRQRTFTVLSVKSGGGLFNHCADKPGDVWSGPSMETDTKDFVLANDVEITIVNDLKA